KRVSQQVSFRLSDQTSQFPLCKLVRPIQLFIMPTVLRINNILVRIVYCSQSRDRVLSSKPRNTVSYGSKKLAAKNPMGRRERTKNARRQQIVQTARQLIE